MPNYIITVKAGPYVAGQRNTGVGTMLKLSERAAEHELRLGTLIVENANVLTPKAQPKLAAATARSGKSDADAKPAATSKPSASDNPTALKNSVANDKTGAETGTA